METENVRIGREMKPPSVSKAVFWIQQAGGLKNPPALRVGGAKYVADFFIGFDQDFRSAISVWSWEISSSTVITVVSSVSRLRTETLPFSTSLAPMTSM